MPRSSIAERPVRASTRFVRPSRSRTCRYRSHRHGARRARGEQSKDSARSDSAQVRDRCYRQHLRRRGPGQGRRRIAGAGHRRRHPRHGSVAPRLRPARRDHRRTTAERSRRRRTSRSSGGRPTRRRLEYGRYIHQTNYSSGLCMSEIAWMGGRRAARHAPQRCDVQNPFPRHQPLPQLRRSVRLAPLHRARRHHHQHRRRPLPHHGRRASKRLIPFSRASSSTRPSPSAPACAEEKMGLGHAFEIDPWIENSFLPRARAGSAHSSGSSTGIRSSGCRPRSTRPATSSRATCTTRCSTSSA